MTTFLPSSHKFAIACGAAGAFVEVSDSVVLNEGAVTRSWGRTDAFSDAAPGTFAFTLDNRDGKFTPGYATGIAPVVLPLAKGMGVSWELNGQIRSGRIRSVVPIFPPEGKPDAARVRVTVDDVLAIAARTRVDSLADGVVRGSGAYLYWPLTDPSGSTSAAERSGNFGPELRPDILMPEFGVNGLAVIGGGQVKITAFPPPGPSTQQIAARSGFPTATYATNSLGSWGVWVTGSEYFAFSIGVNRANGSGFQVSNTGEFFSINGVASTIRITANVPAYVSVVTTAVLSGSWTVTESLYVNGVFAASSSSVYATLTNADKQTSQVSLQAVNASPTAQVAWYSHLSHTAVQVDEFSLAGSTEAERLVEIAAVIPALVLDTLPTDLGGSIVGPQGSGSVLDLFNEIIRGEQGHIYSVSSGTLLAPVEKIRVRARTRPAAVTATFDVAADVIGAPDMGYETTNTVSAVQVTGPSAQVSVQDRSLESLVGSANTSADLAFVAPVDLRAFGEDRLIRGISSGVDVFSIVVNARSTTASRWADMLAMTPGLRYRVTGLPTAQLGFSQWDGWFLGASELHDQENNLFTLHFERTLPATGVFDTDRFMSGGETSLSAGINAAVTSMSVATIGARMSTTDLPYKVQIDNEIVNVTAASGATPQVLTIQRAQNGTTAATHSSGALVESYPDTLFAY